MIKKTIGEKMFDIINIIFLCLASLVTIYPMIHVALASFSDGNLLMMHRGLLFKPQGFSLAAYNAVFNDPIIIKGYLNTIFVVVAGCLISLLLTTFGAYFTSRKGIHFKRHIMFFIVATMFFSGGLIPFYLTVRGIGLGDSLWAVILPYAINSYNLIIMRTAFAGIPDSLEESAKIDGANDFIVLFRIILPLSMHVIAVMLLYYGVEYWNSWFPAMIFINDSNKFPLQLILRRILISQEISSMMQGTQMTDESMSVSETIKYATIMVATVPVLCIYPFLQKYFVKGVLIGSVKG